MKSIKRRFEIYSKKYPQYSGFVVFGETIKGLNFSKVRIVKWFLKLVPREDWKGCSEKQIIRHFQELSKNA